MNSTKNIVWARSSCGKVRKNTSSFRQEPMADVAERGWKRRFDEPITLPRGSQLVTLEGAGLLFRPVPRFVVWYKPPCRGDFRVCFGEPSIV
jgi:hypothetical protein